MPNSQRENKENRPVMTKVVVQDSDSDSDSDSESYIRWRDYYGDDERGTKFDAMLTLTFNFSLRTSSCQSC